ncbi:FUSC family protein [Klebsiella quasipneumoniae subsp. quasipneumoniae]|uniref:FUSC family protein n=1 Tax=Klebsiella quasipneumoniae TaxID=1463165 RepID=UPI001E54723F|nr:FUSC family protein [Klebsiella quasipneumoniae]MCD7096472.1 FUSC family protein [Klebsiella quasipneumoniae subsp. similipneumoniae]
MHPKHKVIYSALLPFQALLRLLGSEAARQRLPFAIRAGLCCFFPVATGVAIGDIQSGLLATIGSFTALYGSDRPYVNRAMHLAIVAVVMAIVVVTGILVAPFAWLAIGVVAAIAALATFLCNVLRVGAPGAYMFALACASGTGMGGHMVDPWQSGFWVLCGGIISWLAHMTGYFFDRYKPERMAVLNAARAVAALGQAKDQAVYNQTRQQAAECIDKAWTTLINWQSAGTQRHGIIQQLRLHLHHLHAIFAGEVTSFLSNKPGAYSLAEKAQTVAAAVAAGKPSQFSPRHRMLPEADAVSALLRKALTFWSMPLQLALRVGLATLIAGAIGVWFKLDHAYWSMAAVVVVLNMSYGWAGTTRRALFRVMGTMAGLVLAGLILSLHPEGLWIAMTVALLQFAIEIWVILQYAVAAIFITANAMVIASGGQSLNEVGHLLTARALDTALGCSVAIAVFILTVRRISSHQIYSHIEQTLAALQDLLSLIAKTTAGDNELYRARKRLHQQAVILQQVADAQTTAIKDKHGRGVSLRAAVNITERATWHVLNACWQASEPLEPKQARKTAANVATLLKKDEPQPQDGSPAEDLFLAEELNLLKTLLYVPTH